MKNAISVFLVVLCLFCFTVGWVSVEDKKFIGTWVLNEDDSEGYFEFFEDHTCDIVFPDLDYPMNVMSCEWFVQDDGKLKLESEARIYNGTNEIDVQIQIFGESKAPQKIDFEIKAHFSTSERPIEDKGVLEKFYTPNE